ncbi:hypothetical protein GHK48_04975 [Sinorhizobium fredii]|uniref:Uncharacterized protein n=1 Tax=Rhizobium fredii TaxID=380 RepID=A0A844A613_RHIFR|nr:hypothetical protein [Sinorhizobium fredii]
MPLQRRASYQMRDGCCSTFNCCMLLSLNRQRFKETGSRRGPIGEQLVGPVSPWSQGSKRRKLHFRSAYSASSG